MNPYQGTKTEENLRAAFSGESMARNKYTYFAMAARKDGLDAVADMFERLAKNEMMHAKVWFEALHGAPKGTADNLMEAARGEYGEWHGMYPSFAAQARADGFEPLATMFEQVARIEQDHEYQFMTLLSSLTSRPKTVEPAHAPTKTEVRDGYRCMFCGAVSEKRGDVCDVCHAIGSFEPCKYEVETN